jgi:hypothetical protein
VIVAFSEAGYLFNDLLLLVYLDGENPFIFTLISEFFDIASEAFIQTGNLTIQEIFYPQKDRHCHAPVFDPFDDVHDVDRNSFSVDRGCYFHISGIRYMKIAVSPVLNTIELCTLFNGPTVKNVFILHSLNTPQWKILHP